MSSELEQILRTGGSAHETQHPSLESKPTPEVILIKDHPHLIFGPHHAMNQLQQPDAIMGNPETIVTKKNSAKGGAKKDKPIFADHTTGIVPTKIGTVAQKQTSVEHLKAAGLFKSYRKGPAEVPVLTGLDIDIFRGEFIAVVGQSGSGKSTLLHLLGTLDAPDQGEIYFDDRRIDNLPVAQRDALRNKRIGMIFQFYHLLPELSTLENVLSPLMIADGAWKYYKNRKKHRAVAMGLLETVGLSHRLRHKPRELSGGEMQRAAIARALVAQPELLLADEPTGNLDQATGQEILKILRTLNQEHRVTIVMVTHDQTLAAQADRIVRLARGRIENEE
jgi:lipoprotein-releasing system ATP-binding protein